jgi:PAS domain-containing protein
MKWSEATLYRSAAPFRYAAAAGIFAFALALRLAILPVESRAAFVTFYPATAFAFYLCGPGPGRMVVALCALSGFYIFTPPDWSLVPNRAGALSLFGFVFSSLLIGWVVQRLQSTTERMNAAIAEARTGERRFHAMLEDQTEFISRFKADSTVLYVNDAFCRMFVEAERRRRRPAAGARQPRDADAPEPGRRHREPGVRRRG